MIYSMLPIKIIHFELPQPTEFLSGTVLSTLATYPVSPTKQHPFGIDWRYRIKKDSQDVASYVAESKFILQEDGIPVEIERLDRLISDLYLNFEIGWENRTRNTHLGGTTLPSIESNVKLIRQQILDELQK
jgi:hypothetical protein